MTLRDWSKLVGSLGIIYGIPIIIVLGLLQTPPPEAYPGQREHREPPKNWYCSPVAKDAAHKCQCKPMSTPTADDPKCCDTPVTEDKTCTVYCHANHCLCPTVCKKG